ncbi:MAG TPA: DUF4173 domain-containing protein [Niabella sp.]|nr:DUF4173 domain-containing protein [Niabella sp.]
MKKNIFFFSSVVLFVLLFYRQEPGINISIFGIVAWCSLFFVMEKRKRTSVFWVLSVAAFVSILSFAWYGDFISFAAMFISLLLAGFKAFYPKLNILSFPFGLAFNYASFIFRGLVPKKWLGLSISGDGFFKKMLGYVLIPGVFVALFIGVYMQASDKFASLFIIDVEFDLFQIAVLSVIGFFLMFNFFYFAVPKMLIYCNGYLKDDFSEGYAFRKAKGSHLLDIASQRRSGEISLVLLNLVLAFFIITYSIEQFGSKEISGTLSNEVHERVYVLIFSIVMAIVVIMIYFQGLLNFDNQSRLLKMLSFIWIGLNILLVLTVLFRNLEYVTAYGLTFKRIGVFVFLTLSLAGLVLTWYKIAYRKTNIFLVNRMIWTCHAVLVVSCVINWSWVVTRYNTSHFQNPDWYYLQSLDYNKQLLNDIYLRKGMDNSHIISETKEARSEKVLSKRLYYEFLNQE